jgi:predicted permease
MATGYLILKLGILNENACKSFTRLLLLVVSPVVIVYSFQIKFNVSLLHGLIISAVSAIGAHVFAIIIGQLVFNKRTASDESRSVLRFAVVYSNGGFIGLPLLAAVIGTRGIFYASVYIAVFNIFVWTHGVALFSGKADKRALVKLALNPNIIAVFIGLLLFCFSVHIPSLPYDGMKYVYNLFTPLAMIVIGARLAQLDPLTLITDRRVLPGIALRNLAVPLVAIFVLHFAGVSGELLLACLIPIACPIAGNTVLFADMYGADTKFPTRLMSLSTLFSVVSIPLLVYIVSVLKY